MGELTSNVTTTLLMRVGPTESIEKNYRDKILTFGCAANWLNYALTKGNQTVGDIFECVFARTVGRDPRIHSVTDLRGKPMGDHLLVLENIADNSWILRYIPTILVPVLCFYSFDVQKICEKLGKDGKPAENFAFNLDEYCKSMGYSTETVSYLFITDPTRFYRELQMMIPEAIESNKTNLTSKRFYGDFNPKEPLFIRNVEYHKHKRNELFWDNPTSMEELFWKLPEYEQQSELRCIIPNINFVQTFDPESDNYDYKLNALDIYLPHLQEYSMVVPATKAHSLYFEKVNGQSLVSHFNILKTTFNEICERMK